MRTVTRFIRSAVGAIVFLCLASEALADDSCTVAVNKAMDSTVAATITLATATKYMASHDDWCDGGMLALEQQDGAAVTRAWQAAIDAQMICAADTGAQTQMARLVATLHRRRLKISEQIAAIRYKCD
jgi:hypothetical protein